MSLPRSLTPALVRVSRQYAQRLAANRLQATLNDRRRFSVQASSHARACPRKYSTSPGATPPQTGFSYPGPRKLNEIVKIQLLNKHGAPRVREIWNEYHKDHKTAVGDVLTADEYSLLKGRSERCKHFVLPVPREGGYFTLLVQFQGKQCFMTYLEDYKTNSAGAQPYLTLTLFDEMLETKGLVLLRGEVTNMLTRQEARVYDTPQYDSMLTNAFRTEDVGFDLTHCDLYVPRLCRDLRSLIELIKSFYLGQGRSYDSVVAFNEASEKFDFTTVLRAAGIGS